MHGLSSAAVEFKIAKTASNLRLAKLTVNHIRKQRVPTNVLAPAQVRYIGVGVLLILKFPQEKRPMTAKANELGSDKAIAQVGAAVAGNRGGQCKSIGSGNVKHGQNLAQTAGRRYETPDLYIIKASPGKGLGMFATRDISKGTRIVAEKPFFSLTHRPEVSSSDPHAQNDISKAYHSLPTSEQLKYMSLHCPERPDCSRVFSIYEANCFEMGLGTCICLHASRINHSCVPNAHYSWNSRIEQETVHAVKEIVEGEEITITYCSAYHTLKERKCEIMPYLFNCSCPACDIHTNFGRRSQIRRQQMTELDQEIADYQNEPPAARAEYGHYDEMSAILRLVNLLDEEGLVQEKSLAFHDAAECALKRGLKEEAVKYACQELDVDICCNGKDSASYKETMNFFLRIDLGSEEVSD